MTQEKENRIREGEEILNQVDFTSDLDLFLELCYRTAMALGVVGFVFYLFR